MLQSSRSDKKLVKHLKNYFFEPKLHKKGSLMGRTENEKQFICRHKNRYQLSSFRNFFFCQNICLALD